MARKILGQSNILQNFACATLPLVRLAFIYLNPQGSQDATTMCLGLGQEECGPVMEAVSDSAVRDSLEGYCRPRNEPPNDEPRPS